MRVDKTQKILAKEKEKLNYMSYEQIRLERSLNKKICWLFSFIAIIAIGSFFFVLKPNSEDTVNQNNQSDTQVEKQVDEGNKSNSK